MGIREGNNLAGIRRVGKNFLITGHRRIEDDFSGCRARNTNGAPAKNATVFKYQYGGLHLLPIKRRERLPSSRHSFVSPDPKSSARILAANGNNCADHSVVTAKNGSESEHVLHAKKTPFFHRDLISNKSNGPNSACREVRPTLCSVRNLDALTRS